MSKVQEQKGFSIDTFEKIMGKGISMENPIVKLIIKVVLVLFAIFVLSIMFPAFIEEFMKQWTEHFGK